MIRIQVDLSDSAAEELAALAKLEQRPRSRIIHDAIAAYLAKHKHTRATDVFGLWRNRKIDGHECQHELRSEWDEQPGVRVPYKV